MHNETIQLAKDDDAHFLSCSQINLICHSVIKQCKTRKSTSYHESVPDSDGFYSFLETRLF